jgi:hypothetical protein
VRGGPHAGEGYICQKYLSRSTWGGAFGRSPFAVAVAVAVAVVVVVVVVVVVAVAAYPS